MFAAALMAELEGVEAASVSMRGAAGDVARARFADGAARQAAAGSGVVETWRLRALVKPGRLEAFRTWADAQQHRFFDFLEFEDASEVSKDIDKQLQARFVGGPGRIVYQQVAAGPGAARWMAEMEVERRPLISTKGNMPFWPHYAQIKSDLTLGGALQAAREDALWRAERLTALVDGDRLYEFLHWVRSNRMGWIWLPAADGAAWRARIAGGYGGVALRQTGTRVGAAQWEVSLTLETPVPVEVKANVGRSIFDPEVALGDASRVYLRARIEGDARFVKPVQGDFIWEILLGDPQRSTRQLEFKGLPSKFMSSGAKAYLSSIQIRFSTLWRLRLISPGQTGNNAAGRELTPAARRGLAFIVAWGGLALPVVIGDMDTTEPYRVFGIQHFPFHFSRLIIEDGTFREGGLDVAVVWNAPGAGNTGFLADFFTTRGGAAAP